jgi:hypothetical protein
VGAGERHHPPHVEGFRILELNFREPRAGDLL